MTHSLVQDLEKTWPGDSAWIELWLWNQSMNWWTVKYNISMRYPQQNPGLCPMIICNEMIAMIAMKWFIVISLRQIDHCNDHWTSLCKRNHFIVIVIANDDSTYVHCIIAFHCIHSQLTHCHFIENWVDWHTQLFHCMHIMPPYAMNACLAKIEENS